jgi:hypothetical protein
MGVGRAKSVWFAKWKPILCVSGDPDDAESDPPEEGGPDRQEPRARLKEQERRTRPCHGAQQEAEKRRQIR